ncbi:MAG: PD-(D/E)XK nuclease family protein [Bryobacterales bacterium]|nr:PD-(D/E)XK nuclease family protein [Bryobacterales bacterium]
MRRLVRASGYETLLKEAIRFTVGNAATGEVLVVGATRGAADDFVRQHCGSVAGVHRMTTAQLTANLAASAMAERGLAPLNALGAEALAARAAYRVRTEGRLQYFSPVAGSPGFARALARTLRDLRLEGIASMRLAAGGAAARDLSALHEAYEELLAQTRLADFPALLEMAVSEGAAGLHPLRGLPLLLLDVPVHSALAAEFIGALAAKTWQTLALVLDGDEGSVERLRAVLGVEAERAAEGGEDSLHRLRAHLFAPAAPEQAAADGTLDFFSAAGEGLECIEMARRMHQLAEEGLAFDEMAIALRGPERYQPLLEEALNRAGIPFYFTRGSVRPDPAGRAFLALLACAAEEFPATRFAEYLSLGQTPAMEAPKAMAAGKAAWMGTEDELLSREEYIPGVIEEQEAASPATPAAWEQLIVDAAVVGGKERWERRLRGLESEFRLRLSKLEDEDEAEAGHLERQLELLGNLQRLALPIIRRLDELPRQATWGEWLGRLSDLAEMTLRHPDSVLLALNELWSMGEVGPVTLDEVFLVLTERLRFLRRPPRKRRYGQVWIGSVDELRGHCFEVVFLPGLAEGVFPKKAFEDPLLLDDSRRGLEAGLPLRDDRVADERLRLRVAAAAARRRLVVSYPRMDVTQNRARVPSFYAMEVVRAAEGRLAELKEFERRAAAGAMTRLGWPAPMNPQRAVDALEFDLAVLQDASRQPQGKIRGRGRYLFHLNPHLARSLRARYMRWDREWKTADGLMDASEATRAVLAVHRLTRRPWSASSLQHFAACPYRFLLHGIHRLRPREDSVPLEVMDPLTRGSLFHEALFQLAQRARTEEEFQDFADTVLDEVAAKFEDDLAPAIPRVWRSEVEDLRADLKGWLRRREQDAAGWERRYAEFAFGMPADEHRDPDSVEQPARILEGILLRGSIDWIEQHRDGDALRITDHKTGKSPAQIPRHVGGGLILQPLLYALAAEELFGKPVKLSRLYYCTQRGGYTPVSVAVTDGARQDVERALRIIDDGIASGRLPAAPSEGQCEWCDFRMVCGPREEERVRRKPPLEPLERLRSIP